jgi:hypothetical protein
MQVLGKTDGWTDGFRSSGGFVIVEEIRPEAKFGHACDTRVRTRTKTPGTTDQSDNLTLSLL